MKLFVIFYILNVYNRCVMQIAVPMPFPIMAPPIIVDPFVVYDELAQSSDASNDNDVVEYENISAQNIEKTPTTLKNESSTTTTAMNAPAQATTTTESAAKYMVS